MKKLSIFVEGQTEQIFVERLLNEIAGEKNINIEIQKFQGEGRGKYNFAVVKAAKATPKRKYYVLIRDCCNDEKVKSAIKDSLNSLAKQNYKKVLGLRDVYPLKYEDIPIIRKMLSFGIEHELIEVDIVLAIMEIEAWFISEASHFNKLDQNLNIDIIKETLKFDPENDNIQKRKNPAKDLDAIYKLVGKRYTKKKNNVERTVGVLDYSALYFELPSKLSSLSHFVSHIDNFFS